MTDRILDSYERLMKLAKSDTAAFESERQALIDDFINNAPSHMQLRLKQLQWEIDGIRTKNKNPMSVLIQLNNKMAKLLGKQQELFTSISNIVQRKAVSAPNNKKPKMAKVLSMTKLEEVEEV